MTGVAGAWCKFVEKQQYDCLVYSVNTWARYLRRLGIVRREMSGRSRPIRLQLERHEQILSFIEQGRTSLSCGVVFLRIYCHLLKTDATVRGHKERNAQFIFLDESFIDQFHHPRFTLSYQDQESFQWVGTAKPTKGRRLCFIDAIWEGGLFHGTWDVLRPSPPARRRQSGNTGKRGKHASNAGSASSLGGRGKRGGRGGGSGVDRIRSGGNPADSSERSMEQGPTEEAVAKDYHEMFDGAYFKQWFVRLLSGIQLALEGGNNRPFVIILGVFSFKRLQHARAWSHLLSDRAQYHLMAHSEGAISQSSSRARMLQWIREYHIPASSGHSFEATRGWGFISMQRNFGL